MMQRLNLRLAAATLGCCVLGTSIGADVAAEGADTVQAIWKPQEITFHYQSFTTFYSCSGLEAKLERILRALGAENVRVLVRSVDCTSPPTAASMPRVTASVMTPVEATPEAIAERDKDKSTRELAARLTGKQGELAALNEQFAANWRRVSLSRGALNLEPGDCELIEEVRRKVLPKLAVRVVKDDVSCSPGSLSLGQPLLEVEALVAAPKPDDAQKETK